MPNVLRFWLFLLLVFLSRVVDAQFPGWEKLGTQQGLLSEESYHVFQDKKGYIWVSTEFGTQIFDGMVFRTPPGSPSPLPIVYAWSSDENRNLLLFTSRGQILRYDGDTISPDPAYNQLAPLTIGRNSLVYQIRKGASGRQYLFSFLGILSYKSPGPLVYARVREKRFQLFRQDGIWQVDGFVTGFDPHSSSKNETITLEVRDFLPQPIYLKIPEAEVIPARYMASEGRAGLLLGMGQMLILIKRDGSIERWRTPRGVVFTQSIQGELYAGLYSNGLVRIGESLQDRETQLPGVSVSSMFRDSTGRLWASTLESGVFRQTQVGQDRHPDISGTVTMLKPLGNRIFIGTHEGRLLERRAAGNLLDYPLRGVGLGQVFDVIQFEDQVLAASNYGVFSVRTPSNEITPFPNLGNNRITIGKFFLPMPGNRLLCSHTRGLSWIRGEKVDLVHKTPYKTNQVAWFRNRVWVASDDGLRIFRLRGDSFEEDKPVFPGLRVMNLKMIQGKLWVSILGKGLFRFSEGAALPVLPALPLENPVLDFAFSPDYRLITAGLDGVFQYQVDAKGSGFSKRKRLSPEKTNCILFWNKRLWMGTPEGLSSIPWPEPAPSFFVPVYLRSFEENGQICPFRSGMQMAKSNKRLTFLFDVLDYSSSRQELSYRLEGPVAIQGKAENSRIEIQNLPPGDYALQVHHPGMRKEQALIFPFSVAPEFWQTLWFQIPTGFILFLLVGLMTGVTVRWYRRKDAEKNQIQRLLAFYRTTALQSQMNPHFVSNALSAIQNLILDGELDKANQYLMKFYRMLRRVLDYSDRTFIRLSEELALIEGNVELERLRFHQAFEFRVELGPGVQPEEIYIPSLITQPLVENAIWHGLLPLETGRPALLVFRVKREGQTIQLDIEDNGVGRSQTKREEGNSRSLRMVEDRMANLNRWRRAKDCLFHIDDLVSPEGQAQGTRVTLRLPLNLNHMKDESLPD